MLRISEKDIKYLKPNEIFVFGSNLSGFHGKGAAKDALRFGAIYRQGVGLQGKCYAIPTKGFNMEVLSLLRVEKNIVDFTYFAKSNTNSIFLVTEIGCGLAGYNPEQIAPYFKKCFDLENVYLPESFVKILDYAKLH